MVLRAHLPRMKALAVALAVALARGFVGAVAMMAVASPAAAQNRGQYILGAAGLSSGVQAPQGLTTSAYYYRYDASTARDASGEKLNVSGNYFVQGAQLAVSFTTAIQWAGATYGVAATLEYTNGSVVLERFGASGEAWGFGDLYVEPINLGWRFSQFAWRFAYGFVAPTGATDITSDYWGHDLTLGVTYFLDPGCRTQLSANSVTEIHQQMRSKNLTVGDNTNLEVAFGHTLSLADGRLMTQLGVAGYAQWQYDDDTGTQIIQALAGQKDRVFAAGPELGFLFPDYNTNAFLRAETEFGARSRAEGWVLFTGISRSF